MICDICKRMECRQLPDLKYFTHYEPGPKVIGLTCGRCVQRLLKAGGTMIQTEKVEKKLNLIDIKLPW